MFVPSEVPQSRTPGITGRAPVGKHKIQPKASSPEEPGPILGLLETDEAFYNGARREVKRCKNPSQWR
jgi:hypothetical protein